MLELPTGTVTFLFTDIHGSTTLWEQHPTTMRQALVRHDALVEQIVSQHEGQVVRPRGEGDSRFAVFARATDAVAAAAALLQALFAEPWTTPTPLRVRIAVHTGEADLREGDYYGSAVNRCARLRAVAHGGQALISLATEQVIRATLPPAITLADLGQHRLKDLQHPEHIFQVVARDIPLDFPALRSLDARPHNLPVQRDPLLGREREVAEVAALVRRPEVGLVTLTGPGGTGKTRLSQQIAAEMLDDFPDGAWFVDLSTISDPTLVPTAIAQVLGIQEVADRPLLQSLKAALHTRHILLVLDNFEQLLPSAALASELLSAAPRLKVLTTSREVLHLYAEHEYPVLPLALPDTTRLPTLDRLTQYAAVALFIQRARAVRPAFEVTNETAPAVAEICVRLDGLPLAIELAAARLKLFGPQALLVRLENRLKLLMGGGRDRAARQQTLRGTIEWSYDLLDEATRRVFVRLGIFVGGCTLEAAEAICPIENPPDDDIDILDVLTSLVDKSLVRQAEGSDGEPRFTMLETIREYARERLEASEAHAAICRQHAMYFMHLAEMAEPNLRGPQQAAWLDRLDVEYANLHAALDWSCSGGTREHGLRLGTALAIYWHLRARLGEGDQWLQRLIADRQGIAPAALARAVDAAGWMAFMVSDDARGRALWEETVTLSEIAEDRKTYASSLVGLATWVSAETYAARALDAVRQLGDAPLMREVRLIMARLQADQGRWKEARAAFEDIAAEYGRLGDPQGVYEALVLLGDRAYKRGLYDEAEAALAAALANVTRVGQDSGIAQCQLKLGQLAHARSAMAQAVALLTESLARFRTSGHRYFVATVLVWLSRVALAQGDDGEARMRLDEGLALFHELDDPEGVALALLQAGRLARHHEQLEQATALFREALVLVRHSELGQYESPHIVRLELLEGLAGLAAVQSAAMRATLLFGGAASQRSVAGVVTVPPDREGYTSDCAVARAHLDEAAWTTAWSEGQAMTLEQAIAYALEETADA